MGANYGRTTYSVLKDSIYVTPMQRFVELHASGGIGLFKLQVTHVRRKETSDDLKFSVEVLSKNGIAQDFNSDVEHVTEDLNQLNFEMLAS